jgi:hypothetical protein
VGPDRGADPACPNQYAYAGGAPFSAADPSGLAMADLGAARVRPNLADRMESLLPDFRDTRDAELYMHRVFGVQLSWDIGPMWSLMLQERQQQRLEALAAEKARRLADALKALENADGGGQVTKVADVKRPLALPGWLHRLAMILPYHVGRVYAVKITDSDGKETEKIYLMETKKEGLKNSADINPVTKEVLKGRGFKDPQWHSPGRPITLDYLYALRDVWNAMDVMYVPFAWSPSGRYPTNCYGFVGFQTYYIPLGCGL